MAPSHVSATSAAAVDHQRLGVETELSPIGRRWSERESAGDRPALPPNAQACHFFVRIRGLGVWVQLEHHTDTYFSSPKFEALHSAAVHKAEAGRAQGRRLR